jgi:sugar phosphate isomerase/epimerase
MRFAICNETFQDWPFEKAFGFAAECGYEGIELAPFTVATYAHEFTAAQREKVRRQAETAGLEICGLHWLMAKTEGFYLTSPDEETRRRTALYLSDLAKLCADLGGRVLVLGSPDQRNLLPGVSRTEATEYATDVIQHVVPALVENDVILALEPLGPEWTDFLRNSTEGRNLAATVDSTQVRLHLDCKAMSSESRPAADIIRDNEDLLAHFHANDPNSQGPGFGPLDFKPILAALQEISYSGWVSVEVFDYTPGIERLARESIEYLKSCLAE